MLAGVRMGHLAKKDQQHENRSSVAVELFGPHVHDKLREGVDSPFPQLHGSVFALAELDARKTTPVSAHVCDCQSDGFLFTGAATVSIRFASAVALIQE